MLNIFDNDAFSAINLTQAINIAGYLPGRIERMGLFSADHVDTTIVAVERKGQSISVVPPTPRGGVGVTAPKTGRDLVPLIVPHFEIDDAINADEVQGVRAFGSQELETVQRKVAQRMAQHAQSMALTEEHARLGAVRGLVVYAEDDDGNVAQPPLDLFETFGIDAADPLDFDLSALVDGDLQEACSGLTRSIGDSLGGIGYDHIHAFVGDEFFDNLLKSPEVRESFKGTSQAEWLRALRVFHNPGGGTWGVFEFGGIVWENYRGLTGNSNFGIPDQEAAFFPVGVPGLFRTVYAPADYLETVNQRAERLYMRQSDSGNQKRREFEVQMNALQYCSRPGALRRGLLVDNGYARTINACRA